MKRRILRQIALRLLESLNVFILSVHDRINEKEQSK